MAPEQGAPIVAPAGWAIERDASTSMLAGNLSGVVAFPAAFGAFVSSHAWLWGLPELDIGLGGLLGGVAAMIAGVAVHEWLHKVGFVLGGASWDDVKFGLDRKTLTPFARCNAPLRASSYRFALGLPGIAIGVVPAVAGVATGWLSLTLFGSFFTAGAVGDLLALWAIRGVGSSEMLLDHPSRIGCLVLRATSST